MNKKVLQKLIIILVGISSIFFLTMTSAQVDDRKNASLSALSSVKFFKENLQCLNCDLSGVNLSHYDPSSLIHTPNSQKNCVMDMVLSGSNLTNIQMDRSRFIACARAGTVTPFRVIDFSKTNLSGAILSHSLFYGVSFENSNLSESKLDHVKINLSNFAKANFAKADLKYTKSERDAMQGWGTNFKSANFSGADLSHVALYGFFQGANFTGANLEDAVLNTSMDAVPAGQKIVKAQDLWKGVNFTDANLKDAHILTDGSMGNQKIENAHKADLSQAILCRTTMPDGSVSNRNCR